MGLVADYGSETETADSDKDSNEGPRSVCNLSTDSSDADQSNGWNANDTTIPYGITSRNPDPSETL